MRPKMKPFFSTICGQLSSRFWNERTRPTGDDEKSSMRSSHDPEFHHNIYRRRRLDITTMSTSIFIAHRRLRHDMHRTITLIYAVEGEETF